jgi:hypothetical protein
VERAGRGGGRCRTGLEEGAGRGWRKEQRGWRNKWGGLEKGVGLGGGRNRAGGGINRTEWRKK